MTLVTCVGLAVRDIIFKVPQLPSGPGKTHASARTEDGGGPAANAAAAIACLSEEARLISVLGEDDIGDGIVNELNALGVDTSVIRRVSGHRSPLSSITVDDSGERAIVNDAEAVLFAQADPPTHEELDGSSAVLVDVRWPTGAEAALVWARENNVAGVVDFDYGGKNATELLSAASHVVFSAGALEALTGTSDPADGLIRVGESTDAWLAVTLGEHGSVWLDGDKPRHVPAFTVESVDTTGAGDVYHGVFTLELARGLDEARAMQSASAAAALSCTKMGGRDGVPTREELDRFLKDTQ
ncbi:MAG TPA: PfkB family carbohydrate kinase [Acidimicrobiia bacterium]|jgi:sulfofructose kinase|nr:PfkB family carbohydrate kinase [Acidimicrobiia bacterium]